MSFKILLVIATVSIFVSATGWQEEIKARTTEEAVSIGVKYLLKEQVGSGWGDGGWKNVPTQTALAMLALNANVNLKIELEDKEKTIEQAIKKAKNQLCKMNTSFRIPCRLWHVSFALLALLQDGVPTDEMKEQIVKFIKFLEEDKRDELEKTYTLPCFIASYLIPLLEAKHDKFPVSDEYIKTAIIRLKSSRSKSGAFGGYLFKGPANIRSVASIPICELALYLTGSSDQEKLQWAVSNFFKYRHELEKERMNKKQHKGTAGVSGHYFYLGYFWAMQALHYIDKDAKIQINEKDEKIIKSAAECFDILKNDMLKIQEDDGSWASPYTGIDGKHYRTAVALVVISGQKLIHVDPSKKEKKE